MAYQTFIASTLEKSSQIALSYFGSVKAEVKPGDNNQVLTQADLEIGKAILSLIEQTYPDHNIIDEEAGVIDKASDFTWVVDPIDGTSNFANALPHFGIMLGLLHQDVPIAGGIVLPKFDQLFVAEKGEGTHCNGKLVRVTQETNLAKLLIAYGIDGHQENPQLTHDECATLAKIILNIRNLRSSNSAFDIAQVILGSYGAFLNQTTKIWDNIAPHILIEEAGGRYTDFHGKPINYAPALKKAEENFTVLAAHPSIHDQLSKIISST